MGEKFLGRDIEIGKKNQNKTRKYTSTEMSDEVYFKKTDMTDWHWKCCNVG